MMLYIFYRSFNHSIQQTFALFYCGVHIITIYTPHNMHHIYIIHIHNIYNICTYVYIESTEVALVNMPINLLHIQYILYADIVLQRAFLRFFKNAFDCIN